MARYLHQLLILLLLAHAAAAAPPPRPARDLLDQVQRRTLRYFLEVGGQRSGLAPERTSKPEVVTTGGSGFGIMALLVGVERSWLEREAVLRRVHRMLDFLESADRFHGAWPHWLDDRTGRVAPFSPRDDGADLVETTFLLQGLLSARQFFGRDAPEERRLRERVDRAYAAVEWTWFTRGGRDVLYWHWSPTHDWAMDLPIEGWSEALLVYVLAAGSSTFPVDPAAYHRGWAGGRDFRNGRELPLGPEKGGPLFLAHYSFLGLDPRGLRDRYADYAEQTRSHVLVNREHCLRAPEERGYSERLWGLTSSDSPGGYAAHSPTHDLGVLSPTAALASFPYTPRESWAALWGFLRWGGGRLWRERGFADAFQPATGWVAEDQLAIDQGPIVVMIENHRTGKPWHWFMSCPEVRRGLERLGFDWPGRE